MSMRVWTMTMAMTLATVLLGGCSGESSGSGEGGAAGGPTTERETGLGAECPYSCDGTFCSSGGTLASQMCSDSDLELPCVGTAAGMYCSRGCSSDADCANPYRPMKCLVECLGRENAQGKCWDEGAHAFMVGSVCK